MINKEINLFLFDYYDYHPVGIIYDWIRNNKPSNTIILKHLCDIPYCKSGSYRLKNCSIYKKYLKIIRIRLLFLFLRIKGYKIISLDKFINKSKNNKINKLKISDEIKKEILRDYLCTKESQASFIDLRYKFVFPTYKKNLLNTFSYYEDFFEIINSKYILKNMYIFNGRALRQKLLGLLANYYKLDVFFIERNMWNKGRTIITKSRVQSFEYLKTNKCKDYLESVHDISVKKLYETVMLKQYKNYQSDLFENKHTKPLISYLSGSSDEYCAFTDEVMLKDCKTQIELVKNLSNFCFSKNLDFLVRVHPNSRKKSKMDLDLWNHLESYLKTRNQVFYNANSNVNTYSIIKNSELLITNGSTVSIEACLLDKIVALCGFNGLRKYNAAYKPKDLKELIDFIENQLSGNRNYSLYPSKESQKYLMDELQSGKKLNHYSMISRRIKL